MANSIRVTDDDGNQYVGRLLLVGITYETHDGTFLRQEQFHGRIVAAGNGGIVFERAGTGERMNLPPILEKAPPGSYRLRSTGEILENPDYLARWTMNAPGDKAVSDEASNGNDDRDNDGSKSPRFRPA